jgi:hypothetical protein
MATESGLLSDQEKIVVTTANPQLSYYFMAGPGCAQYSITWALSEDASITSYGEGHLLLLGGAKSVRKPSKRAGVDAGWGVLLALDTAWSRTGLCQV